ncbi:MAG: carboxypeptidase-like regulatory domain-containing protein [Gemmatimonadetes bacterium]|nr:carboxypeptidase-like regulatory domain-containing protein [Gemmatimonadota bacterium]
MIHRLLSRLLLVVVPLAAVAPAAAQEVRGRLLADADGSPLAGAYVVLVDRADSVVARTVSTVGGAFSFQAPRPGRYTVRADHIGFGTAEAPVAFEPGRAAVVELRAPVRAIELEGLVAEVDRLCQVDPRVGARVVELWEEVGKAFQVTALLEERGTYLMEVDRWRRRLDPERLTLEEEEERRPRSGFHRSSPFASLAAERLAEEGYIHAAADGGYLYYGPDSRVLLSRSFQDTHCFGFTDQPPRDGEPEWVGIRFRPRNASAMDIEGTLWIDQATYAPRRLDFRFTRLPYPLETDRVGGRVEFTRIPQGPWVVSRWRIRVPEARMRTVRLPGQALPQRRYELTAVMEDGGAVLRAKPFDGTEYITLGAGLGRVEGTVRETTGRPIEGAVVHLEGTALRTRTDDAGRFVLVDVPQGRYTVAWTSPALDSLDLPGAAREVDVRPGEPAAVDAVLPPAGVAMAERCTSPLLEDGSGVLRGRVTAPGGGVPPGTLVQVRWETVGHIDESRAARSPRSVSPSARGPTKESDAWIGWAITVHGNGVTASIPVEENGAWMACGLPHDEEMTVWATVDESGRARGATRVRLRPGEIRTLALALPPTR